MKNGDRLTGTVVKSDGKTLVLQTAAGEVTLKFNSIQDIKTEAKLHVTVEGGKTLIGPVTTTDRNCKSPRRLPELWKRQRKKSR